MSSLPLISHHLFVEAAGHQERPRREPVRQERSASILKGIATAIPLELLEGTEPTPANAPPLRAAAFSGQG